ncbi:ATP-dependent DNA ligase [Microbacterium candidum]|uniref:ATP-dependent DNA ligase n=1 Tax=Microbacterium candidum TaxID=3041922 RepID=A0ABT7N1Z0_9MICO|nr:ATP-dependent DNA ligase [Microbacterium sp. ASV49]MDL9980733.1 ATP-dependent DNA ligase [Microbacterium sp. ASV49]
MIPASVRFPPEVVLAHAAAQIPEPGVLPGGCRYEPKWDGFRVTIVSDAVVSLWSRRGSDLTGIFPEIAAAGRQLPTGSLFDGELVIWQDDRLSFEALLRRQSTGARGAGRLSRELPASLVLFDVLALDGTDVRRLAYDERRELCELALEHVRPPIALSPMTRDKSVADGWFADMAPAGIEGLVVKGGAQRYLPGRRLWIKVKRRETVDVVIGAVIGPIERPEAVVVGLVVDGELRIAGQSAALRPEQARSLGELLRPPTGEHPWPEVLSPGRLGPFSSAQEPVRLTLVEPVVAEVSADSARTATSFRHSVRFVRVRPDEPLPS